MSLIVSIRISAKDLSRLFDVVELCSVNPDTLIGGRTPAAPISPASQPTWTISEHEGVWVSGSSAGGSRRYNSMYAASYPTFKIELEIAEVIRLAIFSSSGSFWKNPQFQLVLTEQDQSDQSEDDDDDDEDDSDEVMSSEERKHTEKQKRKSKQCMVLVELLQKNCRQKDKIHFLYIAFHIYKVTSPLLRCSLLIYFICEV